MRVCILVGSIAISGGTYVIVQHANYLVSKGYEVTLAIQEPFNDLTKAWHDGLKNLRCVPFDMAKTETFDLVIATWWKTALELAEFNAKQYAYFVQSIESRFYPEHEEPLRKLVDATYTLPVHYITEVTWIKEHLYSLYAQNAEIVKNGVRKDLYFPSSQLPYINDNLRVLIEGPFRVPFKNVGKTIQLVKKAGVSDITLLTSSPVRWIPGVTRTYSKVPINQVADIYRSCDVLVKLSTVEGMFGPPLEMFHCGGTAVVYDVSGFDEYIQPHQNALVARMGDEEAVITHIRALMQNKDMLADLKKQALITATNWPSWEQSSMDFYDWINRVLNSPPSCSRESIATRVATAWQDYIPAEQFRLKNMPQPQLKHKITSLIRELPPSGRNFIENIIAIYESLY